MPRSAAARALSIADPGYPEGLRDLPDPPCAVYVRGTLPARAHAVAIVGARAATPYGLAVARTLAGDLSRLGYGIVSGLARGIDAAAHRGALEAGGTTVAVLPGALDSIAPRHHAALAETIAVRGGLLSERARGDPPGRGAFVKRNRLIAALSSAVVVVEATEISGALSTAAVARRLGRPLLAVPGDLDRPTSRGCHRLIRGGARLCEGAADVLGSLGPGPEGAGEALESRLLGALTREPSPAEAVARRAGVALEQALAGLLRLEWAGLAAARPGQRWFRPAEPGG